MPITGWIAILVLIVMCYMLIKQYETRMVLFGGGFILCCISLAPMAGLNAFAKTMTNGALITAICSATGFAYCVTYTECDRSLVHYLTRPIRNVGITILVAGLAKANPFDVAKRTFLPMVVAVILLAIFMR